MQQLENKIKQLDDEKINKEVDKLAPQGIYKIPNWYHQTHQIPKDQVLPNCQLLMERVSGNLYSHSFHTSPLDTNGRKNKS